MPATQVRASGGFDPGTDLPVTTITDTRRNVVGRTRQGARAGFRCFRQGANLRERPSLELPFAGVCMSEQIAVIAILVLSVIVVVGVLSKRISKIEQRIAKVSSMDAKLDLLLKHAGLEYDPYKNLPREVVEAVQSGRKIEAIKLYRETTAVGLKEAKDFIEEVQRRGGLA
jgi:ribosomal protein L7/L12